MSAIAVKTSVSCTLFTIAGKTVLKNLIKITDIYHWKKGTLYRLTIYLSVYTFVFAYSSLNLLIFNVYFYKQLELFIIRQVNRKQEVTFWVLTKVHF